MRNSKKHLSKLGKIVLCGAVFSSPLLVNCNDKIIEDVTGEEIEEDIKDDSIPVILSPPEGYDTAKVGEMYFIDLENKNPEKPRLWSFTNPGEIPDGMIITEYSGDISWFPEVKHGGNTYPVSVTLINEENPSKKDVLEWELYVNE